MVERVRKISPASVAIALAASSRREAGHVCTSKQPAPRRRERGKTGGVRALLGAGSTKYDCLV